MSDAEFEVAVGDLVEEVDYLAECLRHREVNDGQGSSIAASNPDSGYGIIALRQAADVVADGSPEISLTYVGRPLTWARRASRKAVSWYVESLAVNVGHFNRMVVRRFESLETRLGWIGDRFEAQRIDRIGLSAAIDDLRKRVESLEAAVELHGDAME